MKEKIIAVIGIVSVGITHFTGVWSGSLITLCVCMACDFIIGLLAAGIFKNSAHTDNGGLSSRVAFSGLVKKICMLLLVGVAHWLDVLFAITYIRQGVIYAFITNEIISLVENVGLCGVPLPSVITKVIEVLQEKGTVSKLATPEIETEKELKDDNTNL